MSTVRRHVRLWAAAWLLFQVASLATLVPRACCAAHTAKAQAVEEATCPLHQARADESTDRCSMRATCAGPMAAVLALLSTVGVLTDAAGIAADSDISSAPVRIHEQLVAHLASPDPPPPRL